MIARHFRQHFFRAVLLAALVVTGQASLKLWAASVPTDLSGPAAKQFVRQIINHELAADHGDHSHFAYHLRKETPKGTTVKQVIETSEGGVSRLIAINDQPLNQEQRAKDEERLQKLLQNPDEQKKKQREEEEDGKKAEEMLRVLPDAFLYQETGQNGDLVIFKFQPDPHFDPPSRESSVYRGMQGTLILDARQQRLVKIDAHMFEDVTFGWGILGRLDKGGSFYVEQKQIEGTRWDITTMKVNMTGKALFFKTINMQEKEVLSDFHRIPDNLSLKQAVDMLEKEPPVVASSARPAK